MATTELHPHVSATGISSASVASTKPLASAIAGLQDDYETPRAPGGSRTLLIAGIVAIGVAAVALAAVAVSGSMGGEEGPQALTSEVTEGEVLVMVTGKGVLESCNNDNLKCQVEGGSKILWIVPDHKRVEKDEVLVRLDDATLKTQVQTQEIALEKAAAIKKQAEEDYKVAVKAVEEYDKGTYIKELQTLEAAVTIAQENLSSAKNSQEHSERMHRKGYISDLQLDAQVFAVKRTTLELASAQTAVDVLKNFTKDKMLTQLCAARDAAESRKLSEQKAYELERTKLADLIAQRERCVIRAPKAGTVVHANENSRGRGRDSTLKIEEGAAVNAQQDIIRMPDLGQMQAKVMISETKINKVREGMPANIKLPQGKQYQGTVTSIANNSDAKSWMSADIREYAVLVQIDNLKETLKPGMSAEVEILIDYRPKVLQVPMTAVVQLGGGSVAWVQTAEGRQKRPLVLGLANDKVVEVRDGLNLGEKVVINPRAVEEEARQEAAREVNLAKRFGNGKQLPEKAIAGEGAPEKKGRSRPLGNGSLSKAPPAKSPVGGGGGLGAPPGNAAPAPSP